MDEISVRVHTENHNATVSVGWPFHVATDRFGTSIITQGNNKKREK